MSGINYTMWILKCERIKVSGIKNRDIVVLLQYKGHILTFKNHYYNTSIIPIYTYDVQVQLFGQTNVGRFGILNIVVNPRIRFLV